MMGTLVATMLAERMNLVSDVVLTIVVQATIFQEAIYTCS